MFEEYNGDSAGNGLTESPCGRCPVADIYEGGPVNAGIANTSKNGLRYKPEIAKSGC